MDPRSDFDRVQAVYLPVALGVAVVVLGAFAYAVLRYRRRERPRQTRDRPAVELGIAGLIAAVVAVLVVVTLDANAQIDRTSARTPPALTVDVTAFKWGWEFRYPSLGDAVDRSSPAHRATLHVPANRPVRFRLRTNDVVHAFWVPAVRFKHDAWPDTVATFELTFADDAVSGFCAQYCGLHHADMTFFVEALGPRDFAAWAKQVRRRT